MPTRQPPHALQAVPILQRVLCDDPGVAGLTTAMPIEAYGHHRPEPLSPCFALDL